MPCFYLCQIRNQRGGQIGRVETFKVETFKGETLKGETFKREMGKIKIKVEEDISFPRSRESKIF